MYLLLSIFFLMFLFFLNHWRKKKIILKVCSMCMEEKCSLLNELIQSLGYAYIPTQDMFTACINSLWQDTSDYTHPLADSPFTMVSDTLPVRFDFEGKPWIIQFRKGQYGIHTGCEIRICHADRILWLPVFWIGSFCMPADISAHISLTFSSYEMARAFAEGLVATGYPCDDVCICSQTVTFTFEEPVPVQNFFRRVQNRIVQYYNHFLCRIYCFFTRFFHQSADRIIFLYYYLPFSLHKFL